MIVEVLDIKESNTDKFWVGKRGKVIEKHQYKTEGPYFIEVQMDINDKRLLFWNYELLIINEE